MPRPRKRGPREQKSPRWSAEWRARLRKARARRKAERLMVRRSALHSPRFRARAREGTTAYPAQQRIRAAEHGLFDNFIGEGGARGTALAASHERLHSAGWP